MERIGEIIGADDKQGIQRTGSDVDSASADWRAAEYVALGVTPELKTPLDQRPRGEACNIFDHGGRYVSLSDESRLFHNPNDHWPDAIDANKTARLAAALSAVAVELSQLNTEPNSRFLSRRSLRRR